MRAAIIHLDSGVRTYRIPQTELNRLVSHNDIGRIVIKHTGHIFAGESIGSVGDKHASLANGTISNAH